MPRPRFSPAVMIGAAGTSAAGPARGRGSTDRARLRQPRRPRRPARGRGRRGRRRGRRDRPGIDGRAGRCLGCGRGRRLRSRSGGPPGGLARPADGLRGATGGGRARDLSSDVAAGGETTPAWRLAIHRAGARRHAGDARGVDGAHPSRHAARRAPRGTVVHPRSRGRRLAEFRRHAARRGGHAGGGRSGAPGPPLPARLRLRGGAACRRRDRGRNGGRRFPARRGAILVGRASRPILIRDGRRDRRRVHGSPRDVWCGLGGADSGAFRRDRGEPRLALPAFLRGAAGGGRRWRRALATGCEPGVPALARRFVSDAWLSRHGCDDQSMDRPGNVG